MLEFKFCEILLPFNVLRVCSADAPENPIRFPNGTTPPRALLNDLQLQESITQRGADAAADNRVLVAEKSREWWDKGMNHNMIILCCHILGIPCAASSPKGPLVESLVNDSARPIWPSNAIAWYQHHRDLFPELTVPVPSVPVPDVPVVDTANALNRLALNDQQDQLQQQGGPAMPPPPPGDHKEQQQAPPEGVPAPPTMFVMSETQLSKILAHHRGGAQQPITTAPIAWQCQSTKLLLRVQGRSTRARKWNCLPSVTAASRS